MERDGEHEDKEKAVPNPMAPSAPPPKGTLEGTAGKNIPQRRERRGSKLSALILDEARQQGRVRMTRVMNSASSSEASYERHSYQGVLWLQNPAHRDRLDFSLRCLLPLTPAMRARGVG